MVNFGRPTNSWDWLASLGHPSKFQQVSCLCFLATVTLLTGGQPNFAQCLAVSWAGTLYRHFGGFCPIMGLLPGAKFTLHPSLAFSYIGSITTWHSSSDRQPNFAAWYKERWWEQYAIFSIPIVGEAAITWYIHATSSSLWSYWTRLQIRIFWITGAGF